jgi:hydroxymethylbilane synthase
VRLLRIGTRGSPLAMWQARAVAAALADRGTASELVTISTGGDQRPNAPLETIGGKGVFVREISDALLGSHVDLAVHSAKDMSAVPPGGLTIAAVLPREDPRDALVLRGTPGSGGPAQLSGTRFPAAGLLAGETLIGTGSPRRVSQLRRFLPAARFESIRGNVDTRLRKLDAGEADALVLACAGLRRLGLEGRITAAIAVIDCVPAPGQGIIAIEVRSSDARTAELVGRLNDPSTRAALAAEQSVVAAVGGGCQLPLGAFAQLEGRVLSIRAVVASLDGRVMIGSETRGDPAHPVEAGERAASDLMARGAREVLNS